MIREMELSVVSVGQDCNAKNLSDQMFEACSQLMMLISRLRWKLCPASGLNELPA